VDRPGYTVENVLLQTQPDWFVAANLYLPARLSEPTAAILCLHGHAGEGKASASMQALCIELARRGYVAMAVGAVGYAERAFTGHRQTAHLIAAGYSIAGLMLHDNMRALDYLESRPEVDPERIGCTGASGGGNQTIYLAALDDRIQAAVPTCSAETYHDYFRKAYCICETVPGVVRVADQPLILGLMAPRALLLNNGILDPGFPILSARKAYDRLRSIYRFYDPEKVALAETYAGHGYDPRMRAHACAWFDLWLMGRATKATEGPTSCEPASGDALMVGGRDGLRSVAPQAKTVGELYLGLVNDLPKPSASPADLRATIIEQCFGGWPTEKAELRPQHVGIIEREECTIEKVAFHCEDDILGTGLLLKPRGVTGPLPVTVFLPSANKAEATQRGDLLRLLQQGHAVFAFEYRGIGETRQGEPYTYTHQCLMLGSCLLAGRAYDVTGALDYLGAREDVDAAKISLWAEGASAMVGLFAAALDERVQAAIIHGGLATYRSDQFCLQASDLVVPNLLKFADLPEVAGLIAPRRLLLANPQDITGKVLSQDEIDATFSSTRSAFAERGGALHLLNATSEDVADRSIGLIAGK
jgi:cephalosporin-C deacetylase-like acetyl esterase